ncbi:hypothetical protein H0X32_04250 [Patescibacteria group bacterium]|jgi:hypothetical protein|nr:hypothetical protein [Patescibacteria group bacterium]
MSSRLVSGKVTAYLPKEMIEQLGVWASKEHRTLSNLVAAILLDALEKKNQSAAATDDAQTK